MNSDLRSYETFYWVAQLGSFSRAAERLHTTQPAVSQRVAGLEEQLGISLLQRSGRRIAVTSKGRELCEHMERLLPLIEDMRKAMRSTSSRPGQTRLGVDETLAATWLPSLIARVRRIYPDVSLDIRIDSSPKITAALTEGRVDLAFVMSELAEPVSPGPGLCNYPMAFVASAAIHAAIEAEGLPAQIDAIIRQPLVTYPRSTLPYVVLNGLLRSAPQLRPVVHCVSSVSMMVGMVRDGLGVGFLPTAIVAAELESGDLRTIETGFGLPDLNFSAAMSPQSDRAFLETIVRLAQLVARRRTRPAVDNPDLYDRITINNFLN